MPGGAGERIIQSDGVEHHFPANATDQDISETLAAYHDQGTGSPNRGLAPAGGAPPKNLADIPGPEFIPHPSWYGGGLEPGPGYARSLQGMEDALVDQYHHNPGFRWGTDIATDYGESGQAFGQGNIKKGLHKAITGTGRLAAPLMIPAAAAAPVATVGAVGAGYGTGKLSRAIAKGTGAGADAQDLTEDIGNIVGGYGGAKGISPTIRGTGRVLTKIGNAPDLPTSDIMPRSLNLRAKILNAGKSVAGKAGKPMSRYGLPQAPNVAPGEPTYQEPDLPKIRPDQSEHYNDVTDQGETNRLMDAIRGHDFIKPSDRPSISPSGQPNYDDVSIANPKIQSAPDEDLISQVQRGAVLPSASAAKDVNSLDLIDRVQKGAVLPSAQVARTVNALPGRTQTPFADATPTPESNTLLRAIRSAPGWPENGLPNKPWDMIHAEDELPHALDTDPYNRPTDQAVQSPGYVGPERRGIPRNSNPQPFEQVPHPNDPESVVWHDGEGQWFEGDKDTGDVGDTIDNPFTTRHSLDINDPVQRQSVIDAARQGKFRAEGRKQYGAGRKGPLADDTLAGASEGQVAEANGLLNMIGWANEMSSEEALGGVPRQPHWQIAQGARKFQHMIRPDDVPPQTVGSQSGADADTAAFNQARQELPNGSLSDHLRRAQEIKEGR